MKRDYILILSVFGVLLGSFLLGWYLNSLTTDIGGLNYETPFTDGFFIAKEQNSPADHIKPEQIEVYKDYVKLDIADVMWGTFVNTNSMDPLIDVGANSLEIKPSSTKDINKGDIIIFEPENYSGLIIHRVTETGYDKEGWYCRTKGDNLSTEDPYLIRFEQIQSIVIGIIY